MKVKFLHSVLLTCTWFFLPAVSAHGMQNIYIVRHGDKASSYPTCGPDGADAPPLCYNQSLMGNNPPLTPCGIIQAKETAKYLKSAVGVGGVQYIVASPFTRTLETALPLARALLLKNIAVEPLISEARQNQGPFRPFNADLSASDQAALESIGILWDRTYGSPPILTPESNALYWNRVRAASNALKNRFPVSSGNLVVVTHATTSFSVAYGLCFGDSATESNLRAFVESQQAIGPAGVIQVVREHTNGGNISCQIIQTWNLEGNSCGETKPYKCAYDDFPAWYWESPAGIGPGRCS